MKKKIGLFLVLILLLSGCAMSNSPTSKVEDLFMKYQKVDEDIALGIDNVIDYQNLTESHKERYRKLLEDQYKNLSYEIKDELVDGDTATVLVEIEVIDYKRAISDLTFDEFKVTASLGAFDNKVDKLETIKAIKIKMHPESF